MKGDLEFLKACLLHMHRQQTDSEKQTHSTSETNSIGFNKSDAPFLTRMAELVNEGREMSPLELDVTMAMMSKYARQLSTLDLE